MAEAPAQPTVAQKPESSAEEPGSAAATVPPSPAPTSAEGLEGAPPTKTEVVDATEDEATQLQCGTCRRPCDEDDCIVVVRATEKRKQTVRCRSCHSTKAAICRIQKKHGALVQKFNDLDHGTTEGFFRDHAHLRGEELKVQMQSTVDDYMSSKTFLSFEGTGEYYDKEDLAERYKNKPDQLSSLMEKTHTFFDHKRGVWLYEDCKYVRKTRDEEERGTTTRRKAKTPVVGDLGEDCPPGSKPSGSAAPKKKAKRGGADPELPKLKQGQVKKLNKKSEQLKEKKLKLLDLLSQAKQFGDMVPPYVCQAAEKSIGCATKACSSLQEMLDKGHGNFEEMQQEMDDMLTDMSENVSRVGVPLQHAEAFKKQS